MDILNAVQVTKRYAAHTALNKVTVNVPENSIFGLLGPNGAGKTSLIRIINQITAPDEGEVLFMGEKLHPNHIVQIGYLPEERGLYKKMKVGEQAMYLAQLKGISKRDAMLQLKEWFEKFEILNWWDKKVEELSKGMQQKIQFIVTILHKPKLLIFDEPFSGFDPINVNLLKEEILNMKRNGSTIIFSTHNMSSVEELCDHIALINKSEKILDGKVSEIKRQYQSLSYEVLYDAREPILNTTLPHPIQLIENMKVDGLYKATIRLSVPDETNHLLSTLMQRVSIKGFHEILPSMNDIFIETVKSNNSNNPNITDNE